MTENVGDRELERAMTVPPGLFRPDGENWLVVVEEDGWPAEVISPDGVVAEDVVVTDAAVPVGTAITSVALQHVTRATAVVVTSGAAVVGVWSGDDLVDAALRGGTRSGGDALPGDIQLPGRIRKKNITRRCRYTDHCGSCTRILVVPEKPSPMPQCPAQAGLAAHKFVW
ncbi:MAG TPA: hypothetical protein VH969_03480 [Actinophytocola sp.]|jgi:hypothetical protein|uniref:hypothetical protein n=1 Tax=Actinophytocola sp. TaxID=1872138 RepID=UPI002F928905